MSEEAAQTPAEQLRELMCRAQNPFDVPDTVLARLETAVLSRVELYGWRHRKSPPPGLRCSSYRHLFLLADGDCLPLWELRYDSTDGDGTLYEVYDSPQALSHSARRVHRTGGDEDTPAAPGSDGGLGLPAGPGSSDPPGIAGLFAPYEPFGSVPPPAGALPHGSCGPSGPSPASGETEDAATARSPEPMTTAGRPHTREYASGNSPEHARRLLRRAENDDLPREDVSRLLSTACGHEILHVPRPRVLAEEWSVWCSLYEHAFLLADGREVSLYELEHNLSPTGRLVCEVYTGQEDTEHAVRLRAREHGLDV
jgi:hypothetical protein